MNAMLPGMLALTLDKMYIPHRSAISAPEKSAARRAPGLVIVEPAFLPVLVRTKLRASAAKLKVDGTEASHRARITSQ